MHHARVTYANCLQCGIRFRLPVCRLKRRILCSSPCRVNYRNALQAKRKKSCLICKAEFIPRPNQVRNGHGKVCSIKCRTEHFKGIPRSPEWIMRSALAQKGRPGLSGPMNPRWLGGRQASYERRLMDGRIRAQVEKYRKQNPERVREWDQNRRGRKTGRLPKGTVARLLIEQGWQCVYCKTWLAKYHVDHIVPLSRGGTHTADNVQILCPSCNVRKSAKDPHAFATEVERWFKQGVVK